MKLHILSAAITFAVYLYAYTTSLRYIDAMEYAASQGPHTPLVDHMLVRLCVSAALIIVFAAAWLWFIYLCESFSSNQQG